MRNPLLLVESCIPATRYTCRPSVYNAPSGWSCVVDLVIGSLGCSARLVGFLAIWLQMKTTHSHTHRSITRSEDAAISKDERAHVPHTPWGRLTLRETIEGQRTKRFAEKLRPFLQQFARYSQVRSYVALTKKTTALQMDTFNQSFSLFSDTTSARDRNH